MSVRPLQVAWHVYHNYLNGVFCIYKPTGMTTMNASAVIKRNLLKELNELPAYDHEIDEYFKNRFSLPPPKSTNNIKAVVPTKVPQKIKDYSKHKLVLGDMFISDNLKIRYLHRIGVHGSGVVVCGVGKRGKEMIDMINLAQYLRVYHVKGRFGYATDDFFPSGKFVERSTFKHVNKGKLDKFCSSSQSGHQRFMFEYAGIDPKSEEAYRLASSGLIRPADSKGPPILYGIKCIYFNPPDFTLEIHAINETTEYLAEVVNDIALKLKTTAVCTHVHRLRYGVLDLDYALLSKEWHLPNIIKNITKCQSFLTPDKLMTGIQLDSASNDSSADILSIQGESKDGVSVDNVLAARKQEKFKMLREKIRNFSRENSRVDKEISEHNEASDPVKNECET